MSRELARFCKHCSLRLRLQSWVALVAAIGAVWVVTISQAPRALSDPATSLRDGVASLPNVTTCGPLRYNPVVAQVAESVVHSTDDYLNHAARAAPINEDPIPELRRLGYGGTKGHILQGHGQSDAEAIKYILLQGVATKPDCYTDFGVAMRPNESTGYMLAAAVFAG